MHSQRENRQTDDELLFWVSLASGPGGLGRSLVGEKGYTLQYSGPENSMDYSSRGYKESDTNE